MARDFNQNRIASAKLGRETLNKFGANFAINYGLDGFNVVDIETQNVPNDIKDYLEGNDTYETFALPQNIEKLCAYALASFPSITDLYLFSESVVEIEDDLSYLSNLSVIYVPPTLLTDYQTEYANVPNILNKLDVIEFDYTLTIPVYDNLGNVLNDEIINYFISGLSQAQKEALTKLIISTDYVSYYSEVWHYNFSEVFENLDNNIYYGTTQIDFTNYIIQGSGELTAGIVETQYNNISVDKLDDITKVTVTLLFTSYASGSISKIQQLFSDMRYLETTYEAGAMELDIQGDIVAKIVSIGKTLDGALVYARSIASDYSGTFENNNQLIILPPLNVNRTNLYRYFAGASNLVYIANLTNLYTSSYSFFDAFKISENLIEANLNFSNTTSLTGSINIYRSAIKRLKIDFNENYSGNSQIDFNSTQQLEKIILNNFRNNYVKIGSTQVITREALINLFNSLGTNDTQQTLTIGATNLAKLTAEDIAIATNKGWIVQ